MEVCVLCLRADKTEQPEMADAELSLDYLPKQLSEAPISCSLYLSEVEVH